MDAELLPDLFAGQVARTPYATAVVDGLLKVDYTTLDQRSNRLAHMLREAGAGPDALVGVCLPRGTDLVVALLAVWKAGAGYVPLDPTHPVERLRWILDDTGVELLVTDASSAERLGDTAATQIFPEASEGYPDTPPERELSPDHLAYAIYTSGSTGRPKGVLISHGAIANRVQWTIREHGLNEADRILQKTTVSFDAAGWEIFAPLSSGGTVVLAPQGAAGDPAALLRAIGDHRVTVLQVVPSLLRLLVDEPGWDACRSLRLVFSAGEPLDGGLCALLQKRLKVQVWNTYGPTECAIDVTAHPVDPTQSSGPVPIGRPIANTRLVVLNPAGDPVPVGMPGELHVGGAGIARGYLGLPALTAERFVPDPFGPPGSRMYRTGDRVRWLMDGTLEYVGRLDDQVKVNGVRVEPGEVESALAEHPDLKGAAVTVSTGSDGSSRLVAFVVSRDGSIPPDRLRGFLRRTLPDSLIPSIFVEVDAFPLTASGKIDRNALQAVEAVPGATASRPLNDAEQTVATVWQDLLGIENVGASDDFFQRGGSSLLLARLAGRLSAAFDCEIAFENLFTAPTVAEQAQLAEAASATVATLVRVERDRPLPLSFEQEQLWFLDRMDPANPEWVTPLLVRLPSEFSTATVLSALEAVVARHEILRTRFLTVSGEPRQTIDEPGPVDLPSANWSGDREELSRLVEAQVGEGFDLAKGPVWRALLARSEDADHVLVLAVHHIASDGRSSVLLGEEIRELSTALHEGREPRLETLPVQYADYAAWQRDRLDEAALEPHLRFWNETLDGAVPLELAGDRPRPPVRDARGAALVFKLPPEVSEQVALLSRQRGATPFSTYLTAFGALLARWSGQWDVTVGVPTAGRTRPELGNLAGPFHNSMVLRSGLQPDQSFEDALDQVWTASRNAFAHRDVPFERVVEELHPVRDLSRTPLFQVMFNYMDEGVTVTGADDLDALQGAWRIAKTDLTLFLYMRTDGTVTGILEYATALFEESTIARMADQYVRLLTSAVADPAAALGALAARTDAPRGPIERRMAELVSELLGREVGMSQNFFLAGGTSRLALVLMAQIQEDFDLDLPVRLIFERPTVARLSEAVRTAALAQEELQA